MLPENERERMILYLETAMSMCNKNCGACRDNRSKIVDGCDLGITLADRTDVYIGYNGLRGLNKYSSRLREVSERIYCPNEKIDPVAVLAEMSALKTALESR